MDKVKLPTVEQIDSAIARLNAELARLKKLRRFIAPKKAEPKPAENPA